MGRLVQAHGLPLAFLGLSLFFLASIILQKGYSLTKEDGVFETLTAVFYATGSLFCFTGFIATRRRSSSLAKYSLLGWAALFLLFALEEISWGQRVIGLDTPEFLASRNLQKETNLHNFSSNYVNRLFYSSVFLAGVALPALTTLNSKFDSLVKRWGIPLPQPGLIVPFALAFAFAAPDWILTAPAVGALLAATGLGLFLGLKTGVMKKDGSPTHLSNLHLWIGLAGVLTILLVLVLFEGNLGHINQPNEIKEFLFSACFLVFAHRVGGIARFSSLLRRIAYVAD